MCFKVENYFAEVDGVLAPSELQQFILDVVQSLVRIPLQFFTQTSGMPRNIREHVMLKHGVCEDG